MKATKVIMPNGKERILVEVKPKEYEAVTDMLWKAYSDAPNDADEKEDKRYTAFSTAAGGAAEQFDDFVLNKDNEAR